MPKKTILIICLFVWTATFAIAAPEITASELEDSLLSAYANGDNLFSFVPPGLQINESNHQALNRPERVRVIITLRLPNTARRGSSEDRTAAIVEVQDSVISQLEARGFSRGRRFNHLPILSGEINTAALAGLEHNPLVVAISLDERTAITGDGRDAIGVLNAHSGGVTGAGVTIAVLDTGIDSTHVDYDGISGAIVAQQCFTDANCGIYDTDSGSSAADINGHGTIVTNVITGPNGYAPDADVVAVRVLDDTGSGYVSDWLAGLDWVIDNQVQLGIDIINMSLSTDTTSATICDTENPLFTEVVDAVSILNERGVTVFASSGNQGNLTQSSAPSCFSNVIAVGATYPGDVGRMPPTGDYGGLPGWPSCYDATTSATTIACFTNRGNLDIVAPGVHTVLNEFNEETPTLYGTSFAAPAVAGVAALMLQENPNLTSAQILQVMQNTGVLSSDGITKLIDAEAAVSSVVLACDATIADGDVAALINAIITGNAAGRPYTICLARNGVYALNDDYNNSGNGFPAITGEIIIQGFDSEIETGSDPVEYYGFHLFAVDATGDLTLNNVTVQNGRYTAGEGGAGIIINGGIVAINDSYFTGNSAYTTGPYNLGMYSGGAIANYGGTLAIHNSVFAGNEAVNEGGAIYSEYGDITITHSVFTTNMAHDAPFAESGGAISSKGGTLIIDHSSFSNNSAETYGGAIALMFNASATVTNSSFANNTSGAGGAFVVGDPVAITCPGCGASSGSVTVSNSTFRNNAAQSGSIANGGGAFYVVYTGSWISVDNSTFSRNYSPSIRVVADAIATITTSTFTGDQIDFTSTETFTITDSTFVYGNLNSTASNTVITNSTFNHSNWVSADTATISNSTFAGNFGGLYGNTLYISNTLIADSNASANCSGTLYTSGANFSTDGTCSGFSQVTLADLDLRLLDDNGGPTQTIRLGNISVAIDAVPDGQCTDYFGAPINTDQRGITRPLGSNCDVGAVEISPIVPTDDFADAPLLDGVPEYEYSGSTAGGTYEPDEPTDCISSALVEVGESHHISLGTGRALTRSFGSGRALTRSFGSGDALYEINTTGSDYDTILGVYQGDQLIDLVPVACDDNSGGGDSSRIILRIPAEDVEAEVPFRVIIWNGDHAGTELDLNIILRSFRSCADVTEIPQRECLALVEFYETTDNTNWINRDGWLDINTPCSSPWFGLTCSAGHVIGLDMTGNNATLPGGYSDAFTYYQSLVTTPVGAGAVVNTSGMAVADDGYCSLIEAILANNAQSPLFTTQGECVPSNDTITLEQDHIYRLTDIYATSDGEGNGLPPITRDLLIEGNGATIERSYDVGIPDFRIFFVFSNATLQLRNLTVQNGRARNGGAVYMPSPEWTSNTGDLILLENCRFQDNEAFENGGAIFADRVAMINSFVIENTAGSIGGGVFAASTDEFTERPDATIVNTLIGGNTAGTAGGGIYMDDGSISGSIIGWNHAGDSGGGLAVYSSSIFQDSYVTITNSVITFNSADQSGGGAFIADAFSIDDTRIEFNTAESNGGGLHYGANSNNATLTDSFIQSNTAQSNGGGIYASVYNGELQIANSTISLNFAWNDGGGLYADDQTWNITIIDSVVLDNYAENDGGGILFTPTWSSDTLTLTGSLVSGNIASEGIGGGVYALGGTTVVTNTTVSGNMAAQNGGGIIAGQLTPAGESGSFAIAHSTIVGNLVMGSFGGAIATDDTGFETSSIESTIIANNIGNNCVFDVEGPVTSNGYNVSDDSTCGFGGTGDQNNTDPLLGGLANNGGSTQTHALSPDSPARDTIAAANCTVAIDQRGVLRNDGFCDSGAYEYEAIPGAPTELTALIVAATQVDLTWTDNGDETEFRIERSADGLTGWVEINTVAADVISYNDLAAVCNEPYYRVRAFRSGDSQYSAYSNIVGVLCAPDTMVATTFSATQVNLTWVDNSSGETAFHIERSPDGENSWVEIDTVASDTMAYSDMSAQCGTSYYRARAYRNDDAHFSGYSNVDSAVTQECPQAPSQLAATPAILQVNLTWTDNSADETTFHIERSINGVSDWVEIDTVTADSTAYSDRTALCNVNYYRVRVFRSGDGAYSSYSNIASATPECPSNDDFDDATVINSLSYTNTQDTATATTALDDPVMCAAGQAYHTVWYEIPPTDGGSLVVDTFGSDYDTVLAVWIGTRGTLQSQGCNDDTGGFQSQVTVSSLAPGIPYYVEVAGYASYEYGNLDISIALVLDAPPAPNAVSATAAANDQIDLDWNSQSWTETEFKIERSPDGLAGWVEIGSAAANAVNYQDGGLDCETTYYYRVRGYRGTDNSYSSYSNVASATTGLCPVDLEINLAASETTIVAGRSLVYVVTVANNGSSTATGVTVVDDLPVNTTLSSTNPDICTQNGQQITCDLGMLAGGGTTSLMITILVDLNAVSDITNSATVNSTHPDPVPSNNNEYVVTTVVPVMVTTRNEQEFQAQLDMQIAGHPEPDIDFVLVDLVPGGMNFTVRLVDSTVGTVLVSVNQSVGYVTLQIDSILVNGTAAPEAYIESINRELPPLIIRSLDALFANLFDATCDLESIIVTNDSIDATCVER